MSFEKVVDARIWGVTVQNSDIRMTTGDSSGGTFTGRNNPLRGTLLWDRCMYVMHNVAVAGGATGGSYSVSIETTVAGVTSLEIAIEAGIGPNSPTTIIMDNSHQSSSSPRPTQVFINQTATGGGLTFTMDVLAKQYRGTLGTAGQNTSERILEGVILRGTSAGNQFGDDRGMTEDETFTLGTTGTNLGMNRIRLWDNALFWVVAGSAASGSHDVDIIANVSGTTFSVASTGVAGILNAARESVPLVNNFYGQCPNPTAIIWTEVNAGGVSNARVLMLAKTGRGSMAKR